ncbi:MAG: hypothetical protein ACRCY4_00115, partial [Brevinema sp.]
RVILLAFARYGVSLLLLIIAVAFGWGAQDRLKFSGVQVLGSLAFVGLTFPVAGMLYYGLILAVNNIILRVL